MGEPPIDCANIPLEGWVFQDGQDQIDHMSSSSDIAGIGVRRDCIAPLSHESFLYPEKLTTPSR